jgi:preprotein translocase subunit SecA
MIGNIFKGLTKIFGSKSDRDLKDLYPLVDEIKASFAQLKSLSDEQLRDKTIEFKSKIQAHLSPIQSEIEDLKLQAANEELDLNKKDGQFKQIEKLEKDVNEALEVVLLEILPQAFAVVKETARRFTENKQLSVNATD